MTRTLLDEGLDKGGEQRVLDDEDFDSTKKALKNAMVLLSKTVL